MQYNLEEEKNISSLSVKKIAHPADYSILSCERTGKEILSVRGGSFTQCTSDATPDKITVLSFVVAVTVEVVRNSRHHLDLKDSWKFEILTNWSPNLPSDFCVQK